MLSCSKPAKEYDGLALNVHPLNPAIRLYIRAGSQASKGRASLVSR